MAPEQYLTLSLTGNLIKLPTEIVGATNTIYATNIE